MKPRMTKGPTKEIILAAKGMPGGVIRWSEAFAVYGEHSKGLQSYWGMNLSRVFDRYFTKVEGVRGHYVLDSMIEGDPTEHDSLGV